MSYFVPANRFSLHGMYRAAARPDVSRRVAQRPRRRIRSRASTANDDLRVHDLSDVRPLHVMNATLNAVSSTKVGRHETARRSRSRFRRFHVGNRETGYRPATEYGSDGGGPGTGLSLGMALAVSGAAASPAMGIYSIEGRARFC